MIDTGFPRGISIKLGRKSSAKSGAGKLTWLSGQELFNLPCGGEQTYLRASLHLNLNEFYSGTNQLVPVLCHETRQLMFISCWLNSTQEQTRTSWFMWQSEYCNVKVDQYFHQEKWRIFLGGHKIIFQGRESWRNTFFLLNIERLIIR